MRRLFSQSWFRLVAFPFSVVIVLLAVARHYGIASISDARAVWEMSRECHPVWRDLQRGRITAGQDVEAVIRTTNPVLVARFGNYVQLSYQHYHRPFCSQGSVVRIVARDGKLVAAGSWGKRRWFRIFFGSSPSGGRADLFAYEAHERSL